MDSGPRSDDQPPDLQPPVRIGCGCLLPASGAALVALTVLLALLIAERTEGFTPLWFVLIPLVLGIVALFGRVTVSRGRGPKK